MEDPYDFSLYKYCIAIVFDYAAITSYILGSTLNGNALERNPEQRFSASLIYQTVTETVIARDELVNETLMNSKGLQEGVIHIPNIFGELKSNYFEFRPQSDSHAVRYNTFLQEAINLLQEIQSYWKQEKKCSDMDFYYAIIIPSDWEYETREKFVRPLFMKAGLIHENDGQDRLIFFSKIEPIFYSMQIHPWILHGVEIKPGDQYILCTLDFHNTLCVNLELISAQYPAFTATKSKWVPQLLKQVQFEIPINSTGLRLSLIAYLKERCHTTVPPEVVDAMLVKVCQLFKYSINDKVNPWSFSSEKPFHGLQIFSNNQYNLKEWEINVIQSITDMDIFENVSGFADEIFHRQMDILLEGTSNTKTRSMVNFYTYQLHYYYPEILRKSIERCSKTYCEQNKTYTLIAHGVDLIFSSLQFCGIFYLIECQIQIFNMRRAPVILPMNTAIENSERCTKPAIFINIDMSPTRTKTAVTYLNENELVKHKTFDCSSIEPLNSFVTYSKLHQKPILRIKNRLKLRLENAFGDYLKLFLPSKRQTMTRRILRNSASKLLDQVSRNMPNSTLINYYRIKSSKNRSKEIKKLFVHSNPNLLKKLTENVEMDDLFTSNDEFCGADNDLFTTCHPGYIFFFVITYLHSLDKKLEDKLENEVGRSWRSNNIWYGVSIDKNLLDTVFGSIKKLEKSFFACGILQKDDNIRKAKFCIRGEEILPAIQRKLICLKFRIKSYFVVAQVFPKHIQLTLHQVVILASSEEVAASIIIQDEIIHIDDVYNNLCKTLWSSMQSRCQIDYCVAHKGMHNVQYDFHSFKVYSDIRQNLKRCVLKLLERNKTSMDMSSKIQLSINSKCTCNVNIFFRDIIEVALMSVIENVATIIAASLINKRVFGNYVANYIFVSGDPFNLSYGSKIHTSYTMLLQKAIDDAVKYKEKDTMTFVLGESLYQLLQLVTQTQPYMFENFITGTLCRVSSETYALRAKRRDIEEYLPLTRINRDSDIKNTKKGDVSYLVFIQKGKPVSTKSLIFQFQILYSRPRLDVIQLDSSKNTVPKKYSVLDGDAAGMPYYISTDSISSEGLNIVVECKQIDYNLSLNISGGCKGLPYNDDGCHLDLPVNFIEPLTLAYI